jgi:hypothetical protein
MVPTPSFYAVRGGSTRGVYNTFPAAQDAGFMRKQGYGNAARFTTLHDAEVYAASFPQPEAPRRIKAWVGNTPVIVRLVVGWLVLNFLLVKSAQVVEHYREAWNCGSRDKIGDIYCKNIKQLDAWCSESLIYTTEYFAKSVVFSASVLLTWALGFLGA